jgi:hypothetical protein
VWTDDRVKILKQLVGEKASASVIQNSLPMFSRNAIMNAAEKHGVPPNDSF